MWDWWPLLMYICGYISMPLLIYHVSIAHDLVNCHCSFSNNKDQHKRKRPTLTQSTKYKNIKKTANRKSKMAAMRGKCRLQNIITVNEVAMKG